MNSVNHKAEFLKTQFTKELSALHTDAPRKWGTMSVIQMIEHMSDAFRLANGRIPVKILTPEDRILKMQSFLTSDKPFNENTKNPLLGDEPRPEKHETKAAAIEELQQEVDHFFSVHDEDPGRTTPNAFYGNLSYDLQIHLLYKHAKHHLKQFGVEITA